MGILLIEDDERITEFVQRGLRAEGYSVDLARDGETAWEMARNAKYQLIILDLLLPGIDGREICRRLRQAKVPSAILMLTALDTLEDKVEGLRIGADDYLTKPFDVRELVARVDNLIALRRRLRERFAGAALPPPALPLAPGVRPSDDDREFLARVRECLRDGLVEEGFNVEALADRLHLDRSHLFRRLRELTGTTPSALILETRMKQAARLLERDDGGVGEVAVAVGFKSVAHFSQRFRVRYGVTPSAYRSRHAPGSESRP